MSYNDILAKAEGQNYTFFFDKVIQKNVSELPTAKPYLFNIESMVSKTLDKSKCDTIETYKRNDAVSYTKNRR